MEASLESNPIYISPAVAANSSHSDSPLIDLTELWSDANQAANYMLSVKRSLDLKRQWVIWDFEALMHQQEAKESPGQWESQDCPLKERPPCQDEMYQGSHES